MARSLLQTQLDQHLVGSLLDGLAGGIDHHPGVPAEVLPSGANLLVDPFEISIRYPWILPEIAQTGGTNFCQPVRIDDQADDTLRIDLQQLRRRIDPLDQRYVGHLPAAMGQINRQRRLAGP